MLCTSETYFVALTGHEPVILLPQSPTALGLQKNTTASDKVPLCYFKQRYDGVFVIILSSTSFLTTLQETSVSGLPGSTEW